MKYNINALWIVCAVVSIHAYELPEQYSDWEDQPYTKNTNYRELSNQAEYVKFNQNFPYQSINTDKKPKKNDSFVYHPYYSSLAKLYPSKTDDIANQVTINPISYQLYKDKESTTSLHDKSEHKAHGHSHDQHPQILLNNQKTNKNQLIPNSEQIIINLSKTPAIQNIINVLSNNEKNLNSFLETIHFKINNEFAILWQDLVAYFYFITIDTISLQEQTALNWAIQHTINNIYTISE